jgi:hypothetical protein
VFGKVKGRAMKFLKIPADGFRIALPIVQFEESFTKKGEVGHYELLTFYEAQNASIYAGYIEYPSLTPREGESFFVGEHESCGIVEPVDWRIHPEEGSVFKVRSERWISHVRAVASDEFDTTRVFYVEVKIPRCVFEEDQVSWIAALLGSLDVDLSLQRNRTSHEERSKKAPRSKGLLGSLFGGLFRT